MNNMNKKKWVILVVVIVVFVLGVVLVTRNVLSNNNSKQIDKTTKNNITTNKSKKKKDDIIDDEIKKEEETTKDEVKNVTEDSSFDNVIVDEDNSSKEYKLLKEFGFYENIGCGKNIYSQTYSNEFKALMALKKVESDKIKTVSCNDIFSDSNLDSENTFYRGESGICIKDKDTKVISYKDANGVYKKLYGIDLAKESVDSTKVSGMYYSFYDYVSNIDSYVSMFCNGCGGSCAPYYLINKIKSSEEVDGLLRIDVYYLHGFIMDNTPGAYKIKTDNGDKVFNVSSSKELFNELQDNYNKYADIYEVLFKKNGNDYIFVGFNKK